MSKLYDDSESSIVDPTWSISYFGGGKPRVPDFIEELN